MKIEIAEPMVRPAEKPAVLSPHLGRIRRARIRPSVKRIYPEHWVVLAIVFVSIANAVRLLVAR